VLNHASTAAAGICGCAVSHKRAQIQAEIERKKLDRKLKSLIERYKVKA
jgi:hypothetical protein